MNYFKKTILFLLVFVLSLFMIKVKGVSQEQLVVYNDNNNTSKAIYYANKEKVMINTEYVSKGTDFRAVWVSPATDDISGYTSMEQYKKQIYDVLDKMDYYNFNVLIFHVRIMNDALYESKYNNWSKYYNTSPDWDALPWIIEECHKRGIEFHAWMNPYRVTNNISQSLEEISKGFNKSNPASNPNNLLKGESTVILNPGLTIVQNFLVDTCMEVVEKYDVDAIHFDDYFYTKGIDDSSTHNLSSTSAIENWRRDQVSNFISKLSKRLDKFNENNNRRVQLGISPTSVYRNGDGVVSYENGKAVTNGSKTGGYAHYGSPLYADTLLWIENEWIDYILPQTYHAITNSSSPFCEIVGWWNKVMKYSNVNLYAAIGYYMNGDSTASSWYTNKKEAYNQVMFCNTMENVKGISIYKYTSYVGATSPGTGLYYMKDAWSTPAILPEIRTSNPINIGTVQNLEVTKTSKGNKISFEKLDDAKFYIIYRSTNPLNFTDGEVIDIIGNVSEGSLDEYVDNVDANEKYYYGVRAQSYSLTLGDGVSAVSTDEQTDELNIGTIPNILITDGKVLGESVTVSFNKLFYPFGDEVNYEISYNFDENPIVTSSNFYMSKNKYCFDINIPKDSQSLYVTIKAYNNLGETLTRIEKKITSGLQAIKNFGYVGTPYSNKSLKLVWNTLDVDDYANVKYILEYSTDEFLWNELNTFTCNENELNLRVYQTPLTGKNYYRIKAIYNDNYTYSNSIVITAYEYLGDFELYVNDENLKDNYIISTYDTIKIKYKIHSNDTSYVVYVGDTTTSYISLKSYSSYYSKVEANGYAEYTITISDLFYRAIIKISANNNGKESESDLIYVDVKKDFISYDEFSNYLYRYIINSYSSLNILN